MIYEMPLPVSPFVVCLTEVSSRLSYLTFQVNYSRSAQALHYNRGLKDIQCRDNRSMERYKEI